MRVLQWVFPFVSSRGGRENFVLNLAQDLAQIGDEVTVLGLDPAESAIAIRRAEHDGWPVAVLGLGEMLAGRQGTMQKLLLELERFIEELRPDVIHNHNPEGPDLLLLRALAKKYQIPVVTTIHGPLLTPSSAAQGKIRLMREVSSRVVAISETSRAETLQHYPDLVGQLELVVNGVPDRHATIAPSPARLRIYASGRFSPEKGFAQLLAAVAMLRQVLPEVELVLAGEGPDSKILPKYAEVLGIADRVRFTGWLTRAEAAEELGYASVVVVPSIWSEPFGLVAVEAMLAGKPVIASRRGELAEIVQDGQTGLLFEPGDVIDLAAKLRLLLEDAARAAELGLAGRRRALQHYGQRRCSLQYRNQYLAVQQQVSNFSAGELAAIGAAGDLRVFPQDLGVLLQDADRLADIVEFRAASKVKPVFKLSHDDVTPLPTEVTDDAVVFRVSMIAGNNYQNEFPLPTLISGEEFAGWEPAAFTDRAAVGFVGQAQHELYHRAISQRNEADVSQVGYELIERNTSLLRTPVNIGLVLRKRALAALEHSALIDTKFVVRDSYHFQTKTPGVEVDTRQEFLDNLRQNAYSLCVRGSGNYSIRLYETLAAGRIPIILNTSMVLPLAHLIDWRRLGVWVELDQIDEIDRVVAEFHASLTEKEFVEKQRSIRLIWQEHLAPKTFWQHALAELGARGMI